MSIIQYINRHSIHEIKNLFCYFQLNHKKLYRIYSIIDAKTHSFILFLNLSSIKSIYGEDLFHYKELEDDNDDAPEPIEVPFKNTSSLPDFDFDLIDEIFHQGNNKKIIYYSTILAKKLTVSSSKFVVPLKTLITIVNSMDKLCPEAIKKALIVVIFTLQNATQSYFSEISNSNFIEDLMNLNMQNSDYFNLFYIIVSILLENSCSPQIIFSKLSFIDLHFNLDSDLDSKIVYRLFRSLSNYNLNDNIIFEFKRIYKENLQRKNPSANIILLILQFTSYNGIIDDEIIQELFKQASDVIRQSSSTCCYVLYNINNIDYSLYSEFLQKLVVNFSKYTQNNEKINSFLYLLATVITDSPNAIDFHSIFLFSELLIKNIEKYAAMNYKPILLFLDSVISKGNSEISEIWCKLNLPAFLISKLESEDHVVTMTCLDIISQLYEKADSLEIKDSIINEIDEDSFDFILNLTDNENEDLSNSASFFISSLFPDNEEG